MVTIAIATLNDGETAIYEVPNGATEFGVRVDAEAKLSNFGDNRKVTDVKIIASDNKLNGRSCELITRPK